MECPSIRGQQPLLAGPEKTIPPRIAPDSLASLPVFSLRSMHHEMPFDGESLTYDVRYGFLSAGEAKLTVEPGPDYDGRSTWRIVGSGRSTGAFDWVFRVRDHYESHLDREGLFPHRFIRRVREGGYRLERDIDFQPDRRTATVREKGQIEHRLLPAYCQDLVSSFYYARSLALDQMMPGEVLEVPTLVDGEIHPVRARMMGRETVSVPSGSYDCWRFTPVVQKGRIWKDADDLSVYVTTDHRRIPVLVKSDLVVGSIRLELVQDGGILVRN
jgi:hypothetical protein